MELKDLDSILRKIQSIGSKKLKLFLWEKTVGGKPIIKYMFVEFTHVEKKNIIAILKAIDKVTPITAIMLDGCEEFYRVTKTEEFMMKPCEAC